MFLSFLPLASLTFKIIIIYTGSDSRRHFQLIFVAFKLQKIIWIAYKPTFGYDRRYNSMVKQIDILCGLFDHTLVVGLNTGCDRPLYTFRQLL